MMKDSTRKALNDFAKAYKGYEMDWERWEITVRAEADISFSTFRKYAKLEKITHKIECTLQDLVDRLNDCAGEDLYGTDWHYEVIDGRAYKIEEAYKWVGMKED